MFYIKTFRFDLISILQYHKLIIRIYQIKTAFEGEYDTCPNVKLRGRIQEEV